MTSHHKIAADLLEATGSSRTTVRLIDHADNLLLMAEVCAPGVESMGEGPQIDPRQFPTYLYLEEQQKPLIQDDCKNAEVLPPPSLTDHYDVAAQMLAPVMIDDAFRGTVSVHQQGHTRRWSETDKQALDQARREVEESVRVYGVTS